MRKHLFSPLLASVVLIALFIDQIDKQNGISQGAGGQYSDPFLDRHFGHPFLPTATTESANFCASAGPSAVLLPDF